MEQDEKTFEDGVLQDELLEEDVSADGETEIRPFSFQTVPMESKAETLDEKVEKVARLLEELLERTADSDDARAMYEDMVNFYNSFDSKVKTLTEKLEKEVDYTRYIETQVSSKSVEKECLMLKKALVEERALMSVKFDEIKAAFDEKMRLIEGEAKLAQESQSKQLGEISSQVQKFSDIDTKITEKLEGFRKDMTKASTNEYSILQAQCKENLAASGAEFGAIKKGIIAFLKSCEKQNEILIRKIPEQKRSFGPKDAVICAMSALCIISIIVQIVV